MKDAAPHHPSQGPVSSPVDPLPLLQETGVSALTKYSSVTTVAAALKQYVAKLNGTRGLDLETARVMAYRELKAHKVQDGRGLVLEHIVFQRLFVPERIVEVDDHRRFLGIRLDAVA